MSLKETMERIEAEQIQKEREQAKKGASPEDIAVDTQMDGVAPTGSLQKSGPSKNWGFNRGGRGWG